MFKIGDFSRLCRVPVSALRYYADLGLLEPAAVEPASGYRYYDAAQLRLVNRIVALKDLGLTLEEVRAVLAEGLSREELRGMLRLKRAEATRRVAEEQERLERVEARLRLIEKEGKMPEQEVVVKAVSEVRGLGMREKVAGTAAIGEFIGDGFAGLGMAGLAPAGPPLTIYHDPEFTPESIDVEMVCPVPAGVTGPVMTPGGRRLEMCSVPAGEVAVLVHVGPYETIGEAYQALAEWVGQHGYRVSGPPQEIYLTSPQDPGPPVTEIRFPVDRA
ncbi:MAG: MerR family transcriptional regulator [Actinobacteria bacterium]|nr:MerR family transcriptional regulator [Actinomycetota bacterium]